MGVNWRENLGCTSYFYQFQVFLIVKKKKKKCKQTESGGHSLPTRKWRIFDPVAPPSHHDYAYVQV